MRGVRHLRPRDGRRPPHLLRPLRAAAPGAGIGRHSGHRRRAADRPQGHGPGLAGVRRGDPAVAPRQAGHRPRALLHHRVERDAQRPALRPHPRRFVHRPGSQRQSGQHRRPAGQSAAERPRLREHLRHRGHRRPAGRAPFARHPRGPAGRDPPAAGGLQRRAADQGRGHRLPRSVRRPPLGAGPARGPLLPGQRVLGPGHHRRPGHPRDRAGRDLPHRRAGLSHRAGGRPGTRGALRLRVHLLRATRLGDEGSDPLRRAQPDGGGYWPPNRRWTPIW